MSGDFVPLPPPPDGLAAAIGEGRRRQRRRRHVVGGSAAGAGAVAVVVVAATLAGVGGTTDSLQPRPAASGGLPLVSAEPARPSSSPRPESAQLPVPQSPPPAAAGPRPAATSGPAPAAAPQERPAATAAPAPRGGSAYRTPDLERSYHAPPNSAKICGPAYSNDGSGRQVPWCVNAAVQPTAEGAVLEAEVCREGTTAGRLSFDSDHEVDLEVLEAGQVLWRWSAGRPPVDAPHVLDTAATACWSWRASWTGVDQRGAELDAGSYTLRVRSHADQLQSTDPVSTDFTL